MRDELRGAYREAGEHLERELRDEMARSAQATRQEIVATLGDFQQTLLTQQGDVARTQNEQIDSFRTQLAAMQQRVAGAAGGDQLAQQGRPDASAGRWRCERQAEASARR